MADRSPYSDTGIEPVAERPPGIPRWVKVFGVLVVVVVLAFVILQLAGVGGDHGPRRHEGPGGVGPPASSVAEHRPRAGIPNHGR